VTTPLEFWYRGIGQYLHPAVDPGVDPAIVALSRNHRHSQSGSLIRLGGGKAMSLVCEDRAILMADITPCTQPPENVEIKDGSWRSIPNWIAEIIRNPPPPPFLVVIHGNAWDTIANWRINQSTDFISLSGVWTETVNRAVVSKAFADLEGIPNAVWRSACNLLEKRKRDPSQAKQIDAMLDAVIAKTPALDAIIDTLPPTSSDDFEIISLLCGDREKNG